jgi:Protein of unknown function (DUF3634)
MIHKTVLRTRIFICRVFNNPLFIIKVEDGIVTKVSGTVKNSFVNDCIEIVNRNNVKFAFIYSVNGSYGKPVLKASNEITADILQQLRNTWTFNA